MTYEVLIPVTIALVELIKRTITVPSRYVALLSVGVGCIIAYVSGVRDPLQLLTVGLAASGLYDIGKEPVKMTVKKLTQ